MNYRNSKELTDATASGEEGISFSVECSRMEEVHATLEAMNRYLDEYLYLPFYRFLRRIELIRLMQRASDHLDKVLSVYEYET